MVVDYSIPLNGILAAERDFEQAAFHIAKANTGSDVNIDDSLSLTDLAAQLVAADRDKIAVKANLKIIETQRDLERECLDLFA